MQARVVGDPPAPSSISPAVSPEVEEIILHAMERDPERRFASAGDMRKELEHSESVRPTGRASYHRAPAPWKILWGRAREFVWALLAIFGFIAAMILVASKWGRHR